MFDVLTTFTLLALLALLHYHFDDRLGWVAVSTGSGKIEELRSVVIHLHVAKLGSCENPGRDRDETLVGLGITKGSPDELIGVFFD